MTVGHASEFLIIVATSAGPDTGVIIKLESMVMLSFTSEERTKTLMKRLHFYFGTFAQQLHKAEELVKKKVQKVKT